VETLFGSSPDDFKDFGVYTVRLYKNGQWVEVSNTCTHTHTHTQHENDIEFTTAQTSAYVYIHWCTYTDSIFSCLFFLSISNLTYMYMFLVDSVGCM
jgi:hypothetical protein